MKDRMWGVGVLCVALTIPACTFEENVLRTAMQDEAELTHLSSAIQVDGGEHHAGPVAENEVTGPKLESIFAPTRIVPGRPFTIDLHINSRSQGVATAAVLQIRGADEHIRVPISSDAEGRATIDLVVSTDVMLVRRRVTMDVSLVDASGIVGNRVVNPFAVVEQPDALDVPALTLAVGSRTVEALAFPNAANSSVLATGNASGRVAFWDLTAGRPLAMITAHQSPIFALALTGDAQRIVSGASDGTVCFTNADVAMPPRSVEGHDGMVRAIAMAPMAPVTVSGGVDGVVRVWATPTGAPLQSISLGAPVNDFDFSPSGELLAVGLGRLSQPGEVVLLNTSDWSERGRITELRGDVYAGEVTDVEFSPDGALLAVAHGRGSLSIWDVASLEVAVPLLAGMRDTIEDLAFLPGTGDLLAGIALNGNMVIWDVPVGRPRIQVKVDNELFSMVLSKDGERLAIGSGLGTVWVFGAADLMPPEGP